MGRIVLQIADLIRFFYCQKELANFFYNQIVTIYLIVDVVSKGCMTSDVSDDDFIKCEFIKRTLKIIDQYEYFVEKNNEVSPQEKFEVTLLMNCLIGLLFLPRTLYDKKLKKMPVTQLEKWGLRLSYVKKWGIVEENQRNAFDVVRRMRNSVAHVNFRMDKYGKEIAFIEFKDTNPRNSEDIFDMKIPKDDLKDFVQNLAQSIIDEDLCPKHNEKKE